MKKIWMNIRGDVMGGITAAIVALPLALAFGIASGAGALAGLYASIFGGITAAFFGGCGVQITGPTGAMTAVLVSIVSKYGIGGMVLAGIMAGFMQVIFGLLRFGKFVKYLPQPVIAGFTNGVAILFFMTGIDDALGALSITVITVIAIIFALRFLKQVPESLFGLVVGLIANQLFIHSPNIVGEIPFKIPKLTLGILPIGEISNLIMPAFTICVLGGISALLSAEVTDAMLGIEHDSNKELIGQGLGNIVSSLVGGVPVSGAVARSGVNVHSGGRTRVSSILHSIFLALMVLVLGPIVRRIPLASLAAILMVASVRTVDWESLKLVPKARWSYSAIMFITTILTVVKNLTIAVTVGIAISGILVLAKLASLPRIKTENDKKSSYLDISNHPEIEIISLDGPLFFIGVENIRLQVKEISEKSILVLDFTDVDVIDETGALALKDYYLRLKKEGKSLYIGGLNKKCLRILINMKVIDSLSRYRVCKSIKTSVQRALKETGYLDDAYKLSHHSTSLA
ncbi:MAG: SulP family inorganic anion transporter [Clostridiaceae bacterium]|nr:SulP family inorganic anion transporter [Clostridiaceae bacterium]